MSDKRFKIPAPPPMYAIRSCIADKAKTIDADRFLELETMVNQSTTILDAAVTQLEDLEIKLTDIQASIDKVTSDISTVQSDLETLQTNVTAKLEETTETLTNLTTNLTTIYNQMITNFNIMANAINATTTLIDYICTLIFPTGTIVYSALPPDEYLYYDKTYGVWGNLPGNWGWCETPVAEYTFKWYDPVTPGTEEPDTSTWETTSDTTTTVDGNKIHEVKIPIYAYYCQAEEEADFGVIKELATMENIVIEDLTASTG